MPLSVRTKGYPNLMKLEHWNLSQGDILIVSLLIDGALTKARFCGSWWADVHVTMFMTNLTPAIMATVLIHNYEVARISAVVSITWLLKLYFSEVILWWDNMIQNYPYVLTRYRFMRLHLVFFSFFEKECSMGPYYWTSALVTFFFALTKYPRKTA